MTVYGKNADFSEDEIDLRCVVAELFCLYSALSNEATVPNDDAVRDCVYGIYRHAEDVFKRLSDGFEEMYKVQRKEANK